MAEKTYDLLFNLLLIGDSGVGKTCLLLRFSDDAFNTTSFISTIGGNIKIKTIELGGKKIKLQIWDTAGQERFRTVTASYYRGAKGIMLVYDIASAKSFDNIGYWLRSISEYASDDIEIILVGNKHDMENERQVPREKAEAWANDHKIKFMEVCAITNINVEQAFLHLAQAILDKTPQESVLEPMIDIRQTNESSPNKCC